MYLVINATNSGLKVEQIDRETLERRLNEDWYGERVQFLSAPPERVFGAWPEDAILIIKGEIVTPTAQEVVTRYVVD